MESKKDTRLLT